MKTTPESTLRNPSSRWPASERTRRPAAAVLLALAMAAAGCSSAQPNGNRGTGGAGDTGGEGGDTDTGGKAGGGTGGSAGKGGGGTGGGGGSTGGSAGMGTGGASAPDSGATENSPDAATGTTADTGSSPPSDGPPAAVRPDAMGQACKTAANEAFTVTAFEPAQTGVFTAWFTATPSIAPTNSVVGIADGDVGPGSGATPLHDLHQILIRFGASGMLDARNGAAYAADTPIPYKAIPYDFRLVVDLPAKKYSAYVSWAGQPEITIGTNLAYRTSARPATKFDHWGVHAVSAKTTVCGFIARAN
jgi:hypothetical protein